ncbi:MAG: glycosyltransferase family 39 protein [Pirellulales bacterium]|nr:glycosyltransferase family 39 protein [Pirellulales bacterium]
MESQPAPASYSLLERPAAILLLGCALAVVLYGLPLLLGTPLMDGSEAVHAAIVQEMCESGEYLMPRYRGELFRDKPPLFFWLQCLSVKVLGMNEAGIRLPGLLCGLLGALTTGLLGVELFGRRSAAVATFFQATMVMPVALAQVAVHDVLLVPCVNLALLAYWRADRATSRQGWLGWTAALGVVLGIALLTKALLGLAFVAIIVGGYRLLKRQIDGRLIACGLIALAIAVVTASPWYVLMSLRDPGYLYYYFIERHLMGFLTPSQTHGDQPRWYYAPVLLGGGLPWLAYLPAAAVDAYQRRRSETRNPGADAQLLCWVWLAGGTLFLCIARSKLATYMLPMFPPVSLLAAAVWSRWTKGELSAGLAQHISQSFWFAAATGPLILPIAMWATAARFDVHYSWPAMLLTAVAAASSWLPLWHYDPHRLALTLIKGGTSLALTFLVIMTVLIPPVAESQSARTLAQHYNRQGRLPSKLIIADERLGSILFYLSPELRRQLRGDQILACRFSQWDGVTDLPPDSVLAIPRAKARRGERDLRLVTAPFDVVGHYRLYRASDARPPASLATATRPLDPQPQR